MKTHRSAKTNVYQRRLLVDRVRQQGWTQRRAAEAAGVSVRTVAKWVGRRSELEDRSSRPRRSPTRLDLVDETAIIRLRRTRATAWDISLALGIPRSTVTRVLARVGLNRVTALEPVVPVQRYERAQPGELLHIDAKRLARIGGHVGHRIHGERRTRIRGAGWETLHVAIDDATRLAYAEVLATDEAPACAAFLGRAVRWYSRRGIRIQRLLTDNAQAYRGHRVRAVCAQWAIRHRFTRPYRPQTNGKAERLIQTLLRHWAYRWPYATSAQRTTALRPYLRLYNHRRPHASLGRRSPWTCFQEAVAR
jgi:transposase InsO family protein